MLPLHSARPQRAHAAYESLAAAFVHTILEWSAVCIAIFTVFLAFIHFSLKRDVTTPVIGVALLCAASMDAFHTLAADRLIEVAADIRRFLPYTDLVAWIIPKDALSSCFSTPGDNLDAT